MIFAKKAHIYRCRQVITSLLAKLKESDHIIGISGLYIFVLCGLVDKTSVHTGLVLMMCGLLLSIKESWHVFKREPIFWLSVILSLYVLVHFIVAFALYPADASAYLLKGTINLLAISGLFSLIVAWWMRGDSRRVAMVLHLAAIGFLMGIIKGIEWGNIVKIIAGERTGFGMGNGAGLYAITAIAGLLILPFSGLFDSSRCLTKLERVLVRLWVGFLFGVFALVFLWSQTRAVWIAAVIVMPIVFVLVLRHYGLRIWMAKAKIIVLFAVFALSVLSINVSSDIVKKRLDQDQDSVSAIVSGDIDAMPASSVSYRYRLWQLALDRISERPLFGWGSGSARGTIERSEMPKTFRHFHNLYLQLALEVGYIGLGLFVLWFCMAMRIVHHSYRKGLISYEFRLFLSAMAAIFLFVSFFQIRHDDVRGQYFLILFGALALTYGLATRSRSGAM